MPSSKKQTASATMNAHVSYEKLLGNAEAAMISAIEIYNKPIFLYRDECMSILLLNAWELLLKALLSKNKIPILCSKKSNNFPRTLSWRDALTKSKDLFPKKPSHRVVQENLDMLSIYRNASVHFYSETDLKPVIYALAQTSIVNFRDVMEEVFNVRLEDKLNWRLVPIGISPPINPISYLAKQSNVKTTSSIQWFLDELQKRKEKLEGENEDINRLLTVFELKFQAVKNSDDSDAVIALNPNAEKSNTVIKKQDPNVSHPLRQMDIIDKIKNLHGNRFTTYTFQAIAYHFKIKKNPGYCWQSKSGILTSYSNDIIKFIREVSKTEVDEARKSYGNHLRLCKTKKGKRK